MRLLFVPALLILGGAIGFGVASSMSDPAPQPTPDRSDPNPRIVETEPVATQNSARHEVESTASESPMETEFADALPESSQGTIYGTILDEDGEPISDVAVIARTTEPVPGYESLHPSQTSEEEYLANQRKYYRWQKVMSLTAHTNDQGEYTISGLRNSTYNVHAKLEHYEFKESRRRWQVPPGTELNFTGFAQGRIDLTLTLPDGSTPKRAQVNFSHKTPTGRANTGSSWVSKKPTVHKRFGEYELTVQVGNEFRSEPVSVSLTPEGPTRSLAIALIGRTGIKGQVILPEDEKGSDANHVMIRHARLPKSGEVDLEKLQSADTQWLSGDMKFSLLDLGPGSYVVGVSRDWKGTILAHEVVEVERGQMVEIELSIPAQDRSRAVVVTVVDHRGKPVEGVNFSMEVWKENSHSTSGVMGTQKSDKSYWVTLDEKHFGALRGEDGNQLRLHVRCGNFGNRSVDLLNQDPIHVEFGPPAIANIQITNYVGHELEGEIQVGIEPVGGENSRGRHFYSSGHRTGIDAEGRQTVGPVEAGEVSVVISFKRGQRNGQRIESTIVDLIEGENDVDVAIPPLYSFSVLLDDKKARGQAMLQPAGSSNNNWHNSIRANIGEGRAEFEYIAEGSYKLTIWGGRNHGTMQIEVPSTEEIRFEKAPDPLFNALAVTINDSEGSLAKAGFQSGDMIVGFGDTVIENVNHIKLFWALARTREEVTVTVDRDQGEVELTVPGSTFADYSAMGGRLKNAER